MFIFLYFPALKAPNWCEDEIQFGGNLVRWIFILLLTCCSCCSSSPGFSWPGSPLLWLTCFSESCRAFSIPQSQLCFWHPDFASPASSFSSSPFCPSFLSSSWAWRWGLGRGQPAARARLGAVWKIKIWKLCSLWKLFLFPHDVCRNKDNK